MLPEQEPQFSKKVVVFSGGTGGFTLLRGLTVLNQPELNIAVPGMWDNGGSTGRLRTELGVLPVGDVRQCLVGLMEDDRQRLWTLRSSDDRFENEVGPLKGHNFLNLQLELLTRQAGGFQQGIDAFREVYRIRGHVYPVTLINLHLISKEKQGEEIYGEAELDERWQRPSFDPENDITGVYLSTPAEANPLAIKAIEEAEIIVFSSGSFWGSIAPHLLIESIREALLRSEAKMVFVSNLMTERGQTDLMTKTSQYLERFYYLLGSNTRLDYLVANQNGIEEEPLEFYIEKGHQQPVELDAEVCIKANHKLKIVTRPMAAHIQNQNLIRHDPLKLAEAVLDSERFVVAV